MCAIMCGKSFNQGQSEVLVVHSFSGLVVPSWSSLTRPIVVLAGLVVCALLVVHWLLHRKKKLFAFRPPKNSRLITRLAQFLIPQLIRFLWKIEAVEIDADGLERLRALRGKRAVLCPNHPTGLDPVVVFRLSAVLGDEFNYLACQECFHSPLKGWLLQQVGCYSIVRGTADTESFRMTRQLLAEGQRWLTLFPEGEACGQNDTVMPFQQGVAQTAFWALADLARQGQSPALYLVPIALKYTYTRDMRPEIDHSLGRLERKLGLPSPVPDLHPSALYGRLRRVGETVLATSEKGYGLRPGKEASLNDRVQRVKETIVARVAVALGVTFGPGQPLLDRIRTLFNAVDSLVYEEVQGSEYERELRRHRREEARALYEDLWRVLRFVATYDGYVRETHTAERFLEILGRLEWEVFGQERWVGPRKVIVRVGEPLNVTDHWAAYQQDKRKTVAAVTSQLESAVTALLAALMPYAPPLEAPASSAVPGKL